MNTVITGNTRGIGLGMSREFLKRGHNVFVTSRKPDAVEQTVATLCSEFPDRTIAGTPCDVSDYQQVQNLWSEAKNAFGNVDIWVNNAGWDYPVMLFRDTPPENYKKLVNINLIGLMHCHRVAIVGMLEQGGGQIWNMEGYGSNGMVRPTASVYGSTKRALRYFTKTLSKEMEGTPVKVCYLSPGMVVTDLLIMLFNRDDAQAGERKTVNLLADTVETVTPFLVEGILKSKKNGDAVRWLTPGRAMVRFALSPFRKREMLPPLHR